MVYRLELQTEHTRETILRVYKDTDKRRLVCVHYLPHPALVSLGEACIWVLAGGYGGMVAKGISLSVGWNNTIRLNSFKVSAEEVIKLQESIEHAVSQGHGIPEGIKRRGESD